MVHVNFFTVVQGVPFFRTYARGFIRNFKKFTAQQITGGGHVPLAKITETLIP